MKQLSLHGTALEISGSGPPVVLLHGVGLNQSIWAGQVKALESDFQVITYDLLGTWPERRSVCKRCDC